MTILKRNLIWLASYPKSGNTWLRVFLTNYLSNTPIPADINNLDSSPIFSSRQIFDENAPFWSSDLTPEEIDTLRHDIFQEISEISEEKLYFKIHDAIYKISSSKYNIPINSTYRAIYLIRNPLDIVASFANHASITLKKSAEFICNEKSILAPSNNKFDTQIRQVLFSWAKHVTSWSQKLPFPVLVIRYEDLLSKTRETFIEIIKFLELDINNEKLDQSIIFSSFDSLKKQECEKKFREKPIMAESFFRIGVSNNWKNELSDELIEVIINSNYQVMKKFNYI